MKRIVVEIDDHIHQQIKERAVRSGRTMRDILLSLLLKWLGGKRG